MSLATRSHQAIENQDSADTPDSAGISNLLAQTLDIHFGLRTAIDADFAIQNRNSLQLDTP